MGAPNLGVPQPAFLFDLDGTLVDSVYQHVAAWQEALVECGIPLSVWRIHRRIGMSGGLFITALQRETGLSLDPETQARLTRLHAEHYGQRARTVAPLPGAGELLEVQRAHVPHCEQGDAEQQHDQVCGAHRARQLT